MNFKSKFSFLLLVGTYTKSSSEGIYIYRFNTITSKADLINTVKGIENPSYLAVTPDHQFVFAVNESGGKNDTVSSLKLNIANDSLELIDKIIVEGIDPCYVSVDHQNKNLFIANYSSGNMSAFSISDGVFNPEKQNFQYVGKSIDSARQQQSHIHATVLSPDNRYLFATDLGADTIYCFQYTTNQFPLTPLPHLNTFVKTGSGPRHLVFSKNASYAYLSNELNATVTVFSYQNGRLAEIQTVNLTASTFTGKSSAADIHLSNDQKFLYVTNRGTANEIVIFNVDQSDGKLHFTDRISSCGLTPRNFCISPDDSFLLVANQGSHNICVFLRNKRTGLLTYLSNDIYVDSPVFLSMIQT
ncbi:MAG: lactonase family protein [Bacteroidetes bacterium]|nr:lactonase family protein [Bacteroidota bacterium]